MSAYNCARVRIARARGGQTAKRGGKGEAGARERLLGKREEANASAQSTECTAVEKLERQE